MKNKKSKTKKDTGKKKRAKERVFYTLNPDFEFLSELRSLILKSSPAEKDRIAQRLSRVGRIKMALVAGVFLNNPDSTMTQETRTDLFVVGDDIDKRKMTFFLKSLEAEIGKEIKFSLMEKDEFEYRYNMYDRFVRELLEGPHEKLINKLGV
jgi:hypothetical protein